MNDWKVIPTIVLTTVLIFGAGVFTGGILVDFVKQGHPRMGMGLRHQNTPPPVAPVPTNNPIIQPKPNRPPEILSKEFLQRLDNDLRLSKDEHDAVQKIIGDGQNQMRKVLQDARLEIREVLTQPQRDQFDDLMKRPFHKPIFSTNPLTNVTVEVARPAMPATNAP